MPQLLRESLPPPVEGALQREDVAAGGSRLGQGGATGPSLQPLDAVLDHAEVLGAILVERRIGGRKPEVLPECLDVLRAARQEQPARLRTKRPSVFREDGRRVVLGVERG